MRNLVRWLAFPAALLAAASATADLYKWVDERGVTNYSNTPPDATARKVAPVGNKLSIYTPDDGLVAATKALRERAIKAMSEPAPEPQGPYVGRIPPTQPLLSVYDQCIASGGMIGCDNLYNNYYPAYFPGVAIFPGRRIPPTRFLPPRPMPVAGSNAVMSRGGMPLR